MNLYEVIRWGNDSADPYTGGVDGADTCFLVRAESPPAAAALADALLAQLPHEQVAPWSGAVYLLGEDAGADQRQRVLRGPYVQHAYCHGWRQWHREAQNGIWNEVENLPLDSQSLC
jgi:hypothetical protein